MKKKKRLIALATVLVLAISLTACGTSTTPSIPAVSAAPGAPEAMPSAGAATENSRDFQGVKSVTFVTGPSGGTMEVVGAAAVEILNSAIPEVTFSVMPTAGPMANIILLAQGEGEVGVVNADAAFDAREATGGFDEQYLDLRGMFSLYPSTLQMWVREGADDINCYADLHNKIFSFGMPGAGSYQLNLRMVEMLGFENADIQPLAWGEAVNALRDGHLDAVIWSTSFPAPAIVDAQTGRGIRLIEISPEELDMYKASYGGWIDTLIPAGTYRLQDKDVRTLSTATFFGVQEDLPEALVYHMTKALWENKDRLSVAHAILSGISEDNVAIGIAELHPGAQRFYEEAGIPTP